MLFRSSVGCLIAVLARVGSSGIEAVRIPHESRALVMSSRKIVARGSRIVVVIGQETVRGSQALVGDLSVQSNEVRDHFAEKGAGKPRTLKLINQVADDRMSLEDLLVVVAKCI